jgi:outer membrane protein assembly factor BamD
MRSEPCGHIHLASSVFLEVFLMRLRNVMLPTLCAVLSLASLPAPNAYGRAVRQQQSTQSTLSPTQRIEVMRSRLETMRRTLNGAIAGLNSKEKGEAAADDPRARLSGIEKEVSSLLSEVNDVRGKQERGDRYDPSTLDKLETALNDLDTRVQSAMRETAADRRAAPAVASKDKKKGGGFLGLGKIFGGGGDDKFEELVGTVAPGRDRELFIEATRQSRKNNYEAARSLYGVIIGTYPDSPYLPLAKLAIADTFYLEGTTSALIQAGSAYQDWVTFFPTHPLADDSMLKMAEVEMRQMGLPDRQTINARKAEQRLKAVMQQFPRSSLKPDIEVRLREVQENLAMHNMVVGNHYYEKYYRRAANNLKGAQSRYREIVEKYPHFSQSAQVLFRLADTYMAEEEPDEAAKYYQRIVRYHPNSKYAEKAKEQLAAIGASIPDPDPEALKEPEPEGNGFFGGLMQEITGIVPKTVDKNGVIIGKGDEGTDIISKVIENNGVLPENFNTIPVQRTGPARNVRPLPASQPTGTAQTQPAPAARTSAPAGQSAPAATQSGEGIKP